MTKKEIVDLLKAVIKLDTDDRLLTDKLVLKSLDLSRIALMPDYLRKGGLIDGFVKHVGNLEISKNDYKLFGFKDVYKIEIPASCAQGFGVQSLHINDTRGYQVGFIEMQVNDIRTINQGLSFQKEVVIYYNDGSESIYIRGLKNSGNKSAFVSFIPNSYEHFSDEEDYAVPDDLIMPLIEAASNFINQREARPDDVPNDGLVNNN